MSGNFRVKLNPLFWIVKPQMSFNSILSLCTKGGMEILDRISNENLFKKILIDFLIGIYQTGKSSIRKIEVEEPGLKWFFLVCSPVFTTNTLALLEKQPAPHWSLCFRIGLWPLESLALHWTHHSSGISITNWEFNCRRNGLSWVARKCLHGNLASAMCVCPPQKKNEEPAESERAERDSPGRKIFSLTRSRLFTHWRGSVRRRRKKKETSQRMWPKFSHFFFQGRRDCCKSLRGSPGWDEMV